MENIEYISLSQLKERGWTVSIIKKLNLTHDKEKTNPFYKCASPMKLYNLSKIIEIEKTPEFTELFEKAEKRKLSAAKAVNTKLQNIKDYVHSIEIKIPDIPAPQIFEMAIEHYNDYHFNRWNYDGKYISSYKGLDNETLIRLTSNLIRHQLTNYDILLEEEYGKVGIDYFHNYLKEKINKMVREKYF